MSFLKFFLPLEDVLQPANFMREVYPANGSCQKNYYGYNINKQSKQMEFGQESLIEDTLKPFESDWEKWLTSVDPVMRI